MILLQPSDFKGKYLIPLSNQDTPILNGYIDDYEKTYLYQLLGVELSNLFIDNLIPSNVTLSPQGDWDASGGTYPGGALENQSWVISVAGTINGIDYVVGDVIYTLIDAPTDDDWKVVEIKNPYGAYRIKFYDSVGYQCGSLENESDFVTLLANVREQDNLESFTVSRLIKSKIGVIHVIDNGPKVDSAGYTAEDNVLGAE